MPRPTLPAFYASAIKSRIRTNKKARRTSLSFRASSLTGQKNCGLLIFPGRLPQAPSERQSAAPLLLLINCVTNVTPFPQKSQTLASKSARGCLPQSLHSPQFSEPDPIYPYLPFLFCPSFGNDRANRDIWSTSNRIMSFCGDFFVFPWRRHCAQADQSVSKLYSFRANHTVQTNDNRSVYGRERTNSSTSVGVL